MSKVTRGYDPAKEKKIMERNLLEGKAKMIARGVPEAKSSIPEPLVKSLSSFLGGKKSGADRRYLAIRKEEMNRLPIFLSEIIQKKICTNEDMEKIKEYTQDFTAAAVSKGKISAEDKEKIDRLTGKIIREHITQMADGIERDVRSPQEDGIRITNAFIKQQLEKAKKIIKTKTVAREAGESDSIARVRGRISEVASDAPPLDSSVRSRSTSSSASRGSTRD